MTALSRTWDRDELADSVFADLRTYNIFRKQREGGSHGGVGLVVRKNLKAFQRTDLEFSSFEFLVVKLSVVPIIFGVFYGPFNSTSKLLPVLVDDIHIREKFSCVEIL